MADCAGALKGIKKAIQVALSKNQEAFRSAAFIAFTGVFWPLHGNSESQRIAASKTTGLVQWPLVWLLQSQFHLNCSNHFEKKLAHIATPQCGQAHFNNALESVEKKDWSIANQSAA